MNSGFHFSCVINKRLLPALLYRKAMGCHFLYIVLVTMKLESRNLRTRNDRRPFGNRVT